MADITLRSYTPPGAGDVELFGNATIYWVNGSGNWSDGRNHWATSSGGTPAPGNQPATDAGAGTWAPNAVFDANSNLDRSGSTLSNYTAAVDLTNAKVGSLTVGLPNGGTAVTINGSGIRCTGDFTISAGCSYSAPTTFSASSGTQHITTNGVTMAAIMTFGQTGAVSTSIMQFQDNFLTTSSSVLQSGTLDTNGQTFTTAGFSWNANANKTLTLGSSTVNNSGSHLIGAAANNTLNAGTSTWNQTGASMNAGGVQGFAWNNLVFGSATTASTNRNLINGGTYQNLTFLGPNANTDVMRIGGTHTVNGTLTFTPTVTNPQFNRPFMISFSAGVQAIINAAAMTGLADWDFADINTTGGVATPWTGTRIGDVGNNSGITTDVSKTVYWVGNTANWSSTNWALSSGGAGSVNNYPLPQDSVIFDDNSLANGNSVTVVGVRVPSVDFSGITLRTGTQLSLGASVSFVGDVTLHSCRTVHTLSGSQGAVVQGRRTQKFRTNGNYWGVIGSGSSIPLTVDSGIGTMVLLDDLQVDSNTTPNSVVTSGGLDLNGHIFQCGSFNTTPPNALDGFTANIARTITSRGGVIKLVGGSNQFINFGGSIAGLVIQDATLVTCNDPLGVSKTTTGPSTAAFANQLKNLTLSHTGSGALTTSSSTFFGNIDLSKYSGTFTHGGTTGYSGDVTFGPNMTFNGGSAIINFCRDSGVQNFYSASKLMNAVPQVTGGGTLRLQDNFDHTVNTNNVFTLTLGTLDLNGYKLTCGNLSSSGATVRTVMSSVSTPGPNDISLKAYTPPGSTDVELFQQSSLVLAKIRTVNTTGNSTVIDFATPTNAVIDRTNPWKIEISGNTASARVFSGGGLTYPDVAFTNATANGDLDFAGSNTLKSLSVTTPPQTIRFTAASTTTIEADNGFPSGTVGNLVTIGSITAANHNLVKSGGGTIDSEYLSISRSQATPSANPPGTWFAGRTSTNGGNNTGWIFADLFADTMTEFLSATDTPDFLDAVSVDETGSLSAVEAVDTVVTFAGDLSESGTAVATISATADFSAALSESGAAADTVTGLVDFVVALSESTSSTDSVTGSSAFFGTGSESGSAADTVSATVTFAAALSETGASAETISATVSFVAALSESGASADTVSAVTTALVSIAETGSASDTTTGSNSTSVATSESGSLVDTVSATTFIAVNISESSTVSDLLTALLSAIRIDESVSADDDLIAELIPPFIDLNIFTPDIFTSVFALTVGSVFTPSLKTFFFIPAPETAVVKPAVMEQFTPTGVTSFKPKADTTFTDMPTLIFTPAPETATVTPTRGSTNFIPK